MKTHISRVMVWVSVALVGAIGVWAGLTYMGVLYPRDAVRLHLNCGKQEYDYIVVVAQESSGDVGLHSYGWKLTYFRFDVPGLAGEYQGKMTTKDVQWRYSPEYSVIARDHAGTWFQWRLKGEDIVICGSSLLGTKNVVVTVPAAANATAPSKDYLISIAVPEHWLNAPK